jgi:hypothetical protein
LPPQAPLPPTSSGRRISQREWLWVAAAAAIILAVSVALNVMGYLTAPPGHHFAGMVYAWEDGQTYLAKIRQGMQGEWLYTLAYTADPGPPFLLYTNYLFLGHVAAWLQLGPDMLFHAARLFDGSVLLFTLYGFMARFFADVSRRRFAFLLAAVGGGIGWLTALLGHLTPDLLQPEMFPFLSILANVHFPLAMAALLWLFDLLVTGDPDNCRRVWARLILGTVILALMAPYGLITIGAVGALWVAAQYLIKRSIPRELLVRLVCVVAIAAPFLGLYAWALSANITLAGPDRQDLTLSPPPWDYLMAFGLVLVPALLSLGMALRGGLRSLMTDADEFLLITWILVTVILIYLPIVTQQRRYSVALFVPIAILAARGMAVPILRRSGARFALLVTSALTNVVLLLVTFMALTSHEPSLFFTQNEWNAIVYLRTAGAPHALVLTSPAMGLFIPAWTGQRVIYGHPVETLDAQKHKAEVTQFYSGTLDYTSSFLKPVDYIFVGPRERALGTPQLPDGFTTVFTAGDVQVWARR